MTTNPKYGVGSANVYNTGTQAFLSTMTDVSGGTFTVAPGVGQYGWYAILASASTAGVTFTDELGQGGWSGAGMAANNTGPSPSTSASQVTFTDSQSNVWRFFRQDYGNAGDTFTVAAASAGSISVFGYATAVSAIDVVPQTGLQTINYVGATTANGIVNVAQRRTVGFAGSSASGSSTSVAASRPIAITGTATATSSFAVKEAKTLSILATVLSTSALAVSKQVALTFIASASASSTAAAGNGAVVPITTTGSALSSSSFAIISGSPTAIVCVRPSHVDLALAIDQGSQQYGSNSRIRLSA